MPPSTTPWITPEQSSGGGQCVQTRMVDGVVEMRNSKYPEAGTTRYKKGEWDAFIRSILDGGEQRYDGV